MLGSSKRCLTYWAFVVAGHWDKINDEDGVNDGDERVLEDERVVSEKESERRHRGPLLNLVHTRTLYFMTSLDSSKMSHTVSPRPFPNLPF